MPGRTSNFAIWLAMLAAILAVLCIGAAPNDAIGQSAQPPEIPAGKDNDLKFYDRSGSLLNGQQAMEKMSRADLVLWVAGNQFFAMDDVVALFQKRQPGTSVGLITLPPGLLLQAIKAGGWRFGDKSYQGLPDVYASVNLGHLKDLKSSGLMDNYMIYMHNELQIMVAKGNPKQVTGIDDLAKGELRTSMPNPVNEGIMQFYARKVLERHGIWQQISAGKECVACATTDNNWFTAVHHRETPERIQAAKSDAGIVWKTEVLEALKHGANVDAVELPASDSLRNEVSYAIGILTHTSHRDAAKAFLDFLRSPEGQDAYANFGFVKASEDELRLKPID